MAIKDLKRVKAQAPRPIDDVRARVARELLVSFDRPGRVVLLGTSAMFDAEGIVPPGLFAGARGGETWEDGGFKYRLYRTEAPYEHGPKRGYLRLEMERDAPTLPRREKAPDFPRAKPSCFSSPGARDNEAFETFKLLIGIAH